MKKIILLAIILAAGSTSYADGFQLNLGYDLWRSVSDVPNGEKSGSMDQGYTIGGEYIWDYQDKFHYGVGGEFRSKLKNEDITLNESIPAYMVGKYDILNHQLYFVGRLGYNIGLSNADGGYYAGIGIGKNVGLIDIEILYENMGYTLKEKEDTEGTHSSVGIKFGFKLKDIYDAFTNPPEDMPVTEPALKPKVIEPEIIKPKIIVEEKIIKKIVIRGQHSNFALNKSSLSRDEKIQLDRFKKEEFNGVKKLIITGYTDSSGPAEYNKQLSKKRAQSVAYYLHIPSNTEVQVIGMGEKETLGGSPKLDRRVEIEVIK